MNHTVWLDGARPPIIELFYELDKLIVGQTLDFVLILVTEKTSVIMTRIFAI